MTSINTYIKYIYKNRNNDFENVKQLFWKVNF